MANIFFIGFMGTGKSTVGRALTERIGWKLVDTDQEIISREKRSIPEIFASQGEAYFRELESQVIADVARNDNQVVTTGGGAVLRQENLRHMRNNGFIISLHATPEAIIERVRKQSDRPLLQQGELSERVHRLLRERAGLYDQADLIIDTTSLTVSEIVEQILRAPNVPLR
jgi:shikimate kinase